MSDQPYYNIIVAISVLILAAVLHEISHGVAADKLGDPTARNLGRITLNPIKHIDLFMTIILPLALALSGSPVIFGGAKPIPVNPLNFRNPRRGMALVAAAGPLCNFVLAAIGWIFLYALLRTELIASFPGVMQYITIFIASQWILINLVLGLFNLFPIPPLDGGRIVTGLLPLPLARQYAKLERAGLLLVFLLLYWGVIDGYLTAVLTFVLRGLGLVAA